MTLAQALISLLQNLSQSLKQGDDKVIYQFEDIQQWQVGVLPLLLDCKLIKAISVAQSIECKGCENQCFMDVINHQSRNYIVCDDSEKQTQMGRILVKSERLKQWQISIKNLAHVLAQLLGFDDIKFAPKQAHIPLGMLKSDEGRKWVNLYKQPLALELNQVQIPIVELLFIDNGRIAIDRPRVDAVLAIKQPVKVKDYQSNVDRLEHRKANTQAMYKSWQDEYEKLKRRHPNKPKGWYAYLISKMDVAQGKSEATIKRNLKN